MSDKPSPGSPTEAAGKPRDATAKKAPAKKAAAKQPAVKQAAEKQTGAKPATAKKPAPRKAPAEGKANRTVETAAAPAASADRAKRAEPPPAQTPSPTAELIRVPMPVRWRDLDAFNHVNNSKYLSYLEEARLHWMLGVPGQGMDDHVAPVVAAAQLNYRRPITWPAEVVIELFVERLGNTSLSIGHRIVDDEDGSVVYCDGNVVMVWIDRDSGRAAALPQAVRDACSGSIAGV